MAYTLVIVKDSRKLREARLEREAAEALLLQHNEDNENKREPATWTTQQAIVEAATASL